MEKCCLLEFTPKCEARYRCGQEEEQALRIFLQAPDYERQNFDLPKHVLQQNASTSETIPREKTGGSRE